MGIDCNRFVDLPECLAKHLSCGICHNILDNAVITPCGHSFCEHCVKKSIDSNHKVCPECRKRLKKRSHTEEDPLVLINDYAFARNFKVNGIISELNIKCEFDFNGCQHTVQLGLLLEHMKGCPHRLCKACGFLAGRPSLHNCFELMKKDRDEWKNKYSKSEEENAQLRSRILVLQEERVYGCEFQSDNCEYPDNTCDFQGTQNITVAAEQVEDLYRYL